MFGLSKSEKINKEIKKQMLKFQEQQQLLEMELLAQQYLPYQDYNLDIQEEEREFKRKLYETNLKERAMMLKKIRDIKIRHSHRFYDRKVQQAQLRNILHKQ